MEIGAETIASEISDVLFEDCDIIHVTHVAMDVQNSDRALCRNIAFQHIRVELDDDLTPSVLQVTEDQKYEVDPHCEECERPTRRVFYDAEKIDPRGDLYRAYIAKAIEQAERDKHK